jgi:DNA uptake protein ComE-like DNA-binding protein
MKDSEGETTVNVALSYYEIYNDKVFDLLEPPEHRTPSGLPLRAEANGRTTVCGLTERQCDDLKDFEKLYIEANNNRVTAATKLNAHSSRSHAILRVKLTQITADSVRESTASAIDLAGSEDNRRTDNGKERLVESAAINKSLFVLSQCIEAIGRGDKRIPYRESKMTRILSLGQNNGITVMILNLAPLRSYHLDTLSSLNVSSRAKRIEVREIENEVVFKQVPRTNSTQSSNGARQPLRPLANAHNVHNVHNGNVAKEKTEKAVDVTRPVKAFSVYTDKLKPIPTSRPTPSTKELRRSSSLKRPSDIDPIARPSKLARPSMIPSSANQGTITVSAADIEAMVEKKVAEVLAARSATEQTASLPSVLSKGDISDAVQRRLEALERRIESEEWRDDSKSDGLRHLLAARQHKEAGEDMAALKSYELALPFFPGQAKLIGKIERLRTRLGISGSSQDQTCDTNSSSRKRMSRIPTIDEHTSADLTLSCLDVTGALSFDPAHKSGRMSRFSVYPMPSVDEEAAEPTSPRSRRLLEIVNSRDLAKIKALSGFGMRRARDVVDYLEVAEEEYGTGNIDTLAQLEAVPGVGGRTVERAHEGLMLA